MKKFLALILSVIMLTSVITSTGISAIAEEEMTTLTLGSNVTGATNEDVFMYEIYVDGNAYETFAYDMDENEHYISGIAEIPADDEYTFEIPFGSTYEIYRLPYSKAGYQALKEAVKTGTIEKYSYYENSIINDFPNYKTISEEEYNEKTNNGENEKQYFYYDSKTEDKKDANELVTGTFYTESLSEEIPFDLGYVNGTQAETPVSLEITAVYNVRKPATSFGVTTYYYTGTITLTAGKSEYVQDYATVPSTDITTAKSNAISSITPIVRTYAAQALSDIAGEKETKAYFADSINEMIPSAKSFPTGSTETKIVDKTTKIVEFNPYQKIDVYYEKEFNEFGDYVYFDGSLVKEHTHKFVKAETVDPTCVDEGYTLYVCEVENCMETEKRDIVPANEEYHGFSRPVSNSDAVMPTCTEPGKSASQTSTCEYCGEKRITEGTEIEPTGHISALRPTEENRVEPTCTKAGSYDEVYYCIRTDCKAEISRKTIKIQKLGHTYISEVTKAATCGKDGVKTSTCVVCGYKKTDAIKATGKHTYTSKVTKKPTSSSAGVMTYTCKTCGHKYTKSIAKLAKASISSLTAKSKGFTAKWKKVSSATGYQIQYSTSSKFSSPKSATITKNSTVSKSVTKLKAKKKYYVRIRTYRVINGTKYYSAWSSSKAVTTKK